MRVASLFVHPVKGCRAVPVESLRVERWGAVGDRCWMVVDEHGRFQSQREVPALATVVARLTDDGLELTAPGMEGLAVKTPEPDTHLTDVRVWKADFQAVEAPTDGHEWFSEFLGIKARLVWLDDPLRRPPREDDGALATFADGYPLLATNEGSLRDLNERLQAQGDEPLPMNRFRPNVVVEGAEPWAEDHWTTLRLPDIELANAKPCGRCVVTTTDQETGERSGKQPLKILAKFRLVDQKMLFGINLTLTEPGTIRVGDPISLG